MIAEKYGFAARVARFIEDNKIDIPDAIQMCILRDKIGDAVLRHCNYQPTDRQKKLLAGNYTKLEILAERYGFTVDFSNPYPSLEKNGHDVHIPC